MNGHFDIGGVSPTRYFFSVAVLLGLLFAMISVDEGQSTPLVFLQWQLQAVIPMALMIAVHILFLKSGLFGRLNPWGALAISGVIGASLFAPLALLIDMWMEATNPDDLGAELIDEWLSVVPPVALCWLAVNAPWQLGYRLERTTPETPQQDSTPIDEQPEFMRLLPAEMRGRLCMLKAELHYLQVVTDRGSSLILFNLSDAIAQLPETRGISVHRSYWVAYDAIEEFTRQGRQGELRLSNGLQVPVSRNRLAAVTEAVENRS